MLEMPEKDKDYYTKWIEAEYEIMGWWPPYKPEERDIEDWRPKVRTAI